MHWPNHQDPWNEWRGAMAGTRMHHGWILAGKRGLGKHDFALAAARELVSVGDAARMQMENDPDIIILAPLPKDDKEEKKRAEGKPYETKRNISVAQIREMQRRLTTRPTLGSRRAIIIDPADDMETSASNALLKSLEEPPQGTFFILVTHRPSRLLPTIRSRCRVLRFPLLRNEQIAAIISSESPELPQEGVQAAVMACNGSLGAARSFVSEDLASIAVSIRALLDQGDPALEQRNQLATAIGGRPSRERIQAVIELAQTMTADAAAQAKGERRLRLIESYQELVKLAGQAPTYNFDPGLLSLEIGTLLARAAPASERANV
jgi:DNA polymerase-3 subunit delta'